jgi:RecA/RadA recombinase
MTKEKTKLSDKKKKLNKLLNKIREESPETKIGYATDEKWEQLKLIPTPFPTLNALTRHDNGSGIPRGKFTTIAGPEKTAKSTLCSQIIGYNHQIDEDFVALWTDAEDSCEDKWLETLGVDLDRIIIHKYDVDKYQSAEDLLDAGLELISTGAIDMWVIDSIGALIPNSEVKKTVKENKMLDIQRKLGEFFRKAINPIAPTTESEGCACVLIGQVYNVPTTTGVGLEEVRGGNALKHWAYLRLKTRRGRRDEGPEPVKIRMPDGQTRSVVPGWAQHIKVEKTKVNSLEGQEIVLPFYLGRGLDSHSSAVTALLANDLIVRKGGWYQCEHFPDGKLQGRDSVIQFLGENLDIMDVLVKELDEKLALEQSDTESN